MDHQMNELQHSIEELKQEETTTVELLIPLLSLNLLISIPSTTILLLISMILWSSQWREKTVIPQMLHMLLVLLQVPMEPKTQLELKIMLFTLHNTKTLKVSKEDSSQQLLRTHQEVEQTMAQLCFRLFMNQYSKRMLVRGILRREASQWVFHQEQLTQLMKEMVRTIKWIKEDSDQSNNLKTQMVTVANKPAMVLWCRILIIQSMLDNYLWD